MKFTITSFIVIFGIFQGCTSKSTVNFSTCSEPHAVECPNDKAHPKIYEINTHAGEECSGIEDSKDVIVHHESLCSSISIHDKIIKMYCEKNSEGDIIFKVFVDRTVNNKLWQYQRFENVKTKSLTHESCKEQGEERSLKANIPNHVHEHHDHHDHEHDHKHEHHDHDHDHEHEHHDHDHEHHDHEDHDHEHHH